MTSSAAATPNLETAASDAVTISLCICTMNRPADLKRALAAVFENTHPPDQVIVSDDGAEGNAVRSVVEEFEGATYVEGPRRGLAANRNRCLEHVQSRYVIFIDDDVVVGREFFAAARRILAETPEKTVVSGVEINHGGARREVSPHNIDFLGLQRQEVRSQYRSCVINCTFFPRRLFDQALFDENLRYGSEEVEMAEHAVSLGYRIVLNKELFVDHFPSAINRDIYSSYRSASRLYATFKIYWFYRKNPPLALIFAVLAPLQLLASGLRRGGLKGGISALKSIALAATYLKKIPPK